MTDWRRTLDELAGAGLLRRPVTVEGGQAAHVRVNGADYACFCSNNYLGLANHPEVVEAGIQALRRYGAGTASVRFICGTFTVHRELEHELADFVGTAASLSYVSCWNANEGLMPTVLGPEDVVISDKLNHASIIDGCRLSRARVVRYSHNDVADLRRNLDETTEYGRRLIVTDGVFSMDGDIAPLDQLYEVAEKYGVMTMVDDAHGEGVLGGGKGIVHHFGLQGSFDVEIGTLSKAFGVVGGVIAGKRVVVDYLRQKARPFLFSSAVTPPDTAACLAAVDLLEESSELVDRLWSNTEYFKRGMVELGFDTGQSETPIVPVMLGEAPLAKEFSRKLFENGVFAMALGFPTVPRGKARIRVMNTAAHSQDDLDVGLAAFEKVGRELGII